MLRDPKHFLIVHRIQNWLRQFCERPIGNTIDLEGHQPDAFENAMSLVESDIGPALVRIVAAKSLASQDDRVLLLNLIGLLHTRNPRLRERFRGFRDRVAKAVLDVAMSIRQVPTRDPTCVMFDDGVL